MNTQTTVLASQTGAVAGRRQTMRVGGVIRRAPLGLLLLLAAVAWIILIVVLIAMDPTAGTGNPMD